MEQQPSLNNPNLHLHEPEAHPPKFIARNLLLKLFLFEYAAFAIGARDNQPA